MSTSNILVATLGKVWQLIPELVGFINPQSFPLYRHHSQASSINKMRNKYHIQPIDKVWLIATDSAGDKDETIENLLEWQHATVPDIELKFFILKNVTDFTEAAHIRQMTDLIYRVVLHATEHFGSADVLLSLAGGRKTMSADMQQAGNLFGCQAMLHVTDNMQISRQPFVQSFLFREPLPKEYGDAYLPLVISGKLQKNVALNFNPALKSAAFPLNTNETSNYCEPYTALADKIESRLEEARNLMYNYSLTLSGKYKQTNYRALYALEPEQIRALQTTHLGLDPKKKAQEEAFLQKLPKAELHCHFGGILTADEMIEVARANMPEIENKSKSNPKFAQWLNATRDKINARDLAGLQADVPEFKNLRRRFSAIPEPISVAAFLSLFDGKAELLDRFIFGKFLDDKAYQGLGIIGYEKLGDLQGSGLLQSEAGIRAACRILIRKCQTENIRYLELRQSPVKYTRGGLTAVEVAEMIRQELQKADQTIFKAVFITSRHGKMSEVHQHIELAQELFERDPAYREWIVGFDLAGAEDARRPAELRSAFLPLRKESMNITIHAGETESVQNIWEAVYELNADRIGHGLTLNEDAKLKSRILNRKISIEMCPSSNTQIVRFDPDSQKKYPLKQYLDEGLRVTVNTDNPGISRTSLSREYYRAAALSPGGLSQWEILRIIRNGFRGAFLPFPERQKLLLDSEKEIINLLKEMNDEKS